MTATTTTATTAMTATVTVTTATVMVVTAMVTVTACWATLTAGTVAMGRAGTILTTWTTATTGGTGPTAGRICSTALRALGNTTRPARTIMTGRGTRRTCSDLGSTGITTHSRILALAATVVRR